MRYALTIGVEQHVSYDKNSADIPSVYRPMGYQPEVEAWTEIGSKLCTGIDSM